MAGEQTRVTPGVWDRGEFRVRKPYQTTTMFIFSRKSAKLSDDFMWSKSWFQFLGAAKEKARLLIRSLVIEPGLDINDLRRFVNITTF